MFSKGEIPQEVIEISDKLEKSGFEAYLVGGCVRDLILKREPKDWDFTTNAKPHEIIDIFPDSFYENTFGTVGVKTRSEVEKLKVVEITPYRLEGKYSDKRHPDKVLFSDKIEDDLKRRDFTINAIAYSISKGQVIDPYKGQESIKDKTIRTVGDPEERFDEDALRMLRGIRFSSELGFIIEMETAKAIQKMSGFTRNVSRERIREEFDKIIMSDNPMLGLGMAQRLGVLPHISEVLEEMVGVSQETEAHIYDVWEHTLRTLQHAADKKYPREVRLAALFHDSAKPATKRMVGNKATFYSHDVLGANVARETLKNLKYDNKTVEKVEKLVRWHMFFSDTEEITHSAIRRLLRNVGKENIWDLMNLRKCDRVGTGRPKEEPYRLRKFQSMIDEVMRDPISVQMLKINGNDLMKEVGVTSGPKIGYVLHALLEEVMEDPTKNTKEFLVKRSSELAKLEENDIKKLGEQGKASKKRIEEEEIEKLRSKRHVK